ncbi:EamA-like transporter family protein [Botrimarina hoheduenensis]|uniref:EamA-like transporter family protein n=2 Tax=Botrimarina hoheduenensis TaxID=2528000 RepID=A0A5C5W9F6_9BACT|nr:EamA-like transporter family protein [Botrimarina hoheduenensis]
MATPAPSQIAPLMLVLAGVMACSTSVLWIKLSAIDPVLLTALRLGLAAALLTPFALRDARKHWSVLNWTHLRDACIPGAVLAAHFISWIFGARMTLASNGTLIVNLTPLATPFLLAVLSREHVTRREILATAIALMGLAILFVSDYHASAETFLGDWICFGSMLLFAVYLTLGRRFRHHPTHLLFITPLYGAAALTALGCTPLTAGEPIDWSREWLWVVLLTVVPTLIGHSALLAAIRHLRGQVVSVLNMTQFLFAAVFAWLMLDEVPPAAIAPAAACVLAAGLIAVWPERAAAKPGGAD